MILILTVTSCSNVDYDTENLNTQSIDNTVDTTIVTNDETSVETPIYDDAVGGDYDQLSFKYQFYADGVDFVKNTFAVDREDEINEIISEYHKIYAYEKWAQRPPVLWYLIREMNLTKDDIIKYYEVRIGGYNEEVIDSLFIEEIDEVKKAVKSPYVLYADGNLYNIYELSAMSSDEIAQLDIQKEDMTQFVENIEEYLERDLSKRDTIFYDGMHDILDRIVSEEAIHEILN